jgi:hypothetical protein
MESRFGLTWHTSTHLAHTHWWCHACHGSHGHSSHGHSAHHPISHSSTTPSHTSRTTAHAIHHSATIEASELTTHLATHLTALETSHYWLETAGHASHLWSREVPVEASTTRIAHIATIRTITRSATTEVVGLPIPIVIDSGI